MKILSITAGAANMYCGSCLRDNALAAEMIRQGHDVILVPLYTPTRTDEANVSHKRVFFSGINLYLQHKSPAFQRRLSGFERLLDSPRLIRWVTKKKMSVEPAQLGEMTVSMLEGEHGPHRKEMDKLLEWATRESPPDIIHLPYTLVISLAKPLRQALDRPVCCSMQGEDLFIEGLPEKYRSKALELIRSQVEYVDAFMPVSAFYSKLMAEYLSIPDREDVCCSDRDQHGRPQLSAKARRKAIQNRVFGKNCAGKGVACSGGSVQGSAVAKGPGRDDARGGGLPAAGKRGVSKRYRGEAEGLGPGGPNAVSRRVDAGRENQLPALD